MIATNTTFMILACIAVILRIYTRMRKSPPLRADDYLIVGALGRQANSQTHLFRTLILGLYVGILCLPSRDQYRWYSRRGLRDAVRIIEF